MKRLLLLSGKFCILVGIAAVLLFFSAPLLLNTLLLPRLSSIDGTGDLSIHLDQLSPWQLRGEITLKHGEESPAISGRFQADYTPQGLLARRIDAISLNGLKLRLRYVGGRLQLAGLPAAEENDGSSAALAALPPLPFAVPKLSLRDCRILLEQTDAPTLPFSLQGDLSPQFTSTRNGGFQLTGLQARFRSEELFALSLNIELNLIGEEARLALDGRFVGIEAISRLLQLPGDLQIGGDMEFVGQTVLDGGWQPVGRSTFLLRFPQLTVGNEGFALSSATEGPLELQGGGTWESLDFALTNLQITAPFTAGADLAGSYRPATGELAGRGEIRSEQLQSPATFDLEGTLGGGSARLGITLQGESQELHAGVTTVRLGPYRLNGRLAAEGETLALTAETQISSVSLPEQELLLEEIAGQLRYAPDSTEMETDQPGTFSIKRIRLRREALASLTANLAQTPEGFSFGGEAASLRNSRLRLKFSGTATPAGAMAFSFILPEAEITNATLPALIALPKGAAFGGRVEAKGELAYASGTLQGATSISLKDAMFEMKEKQLHLEGISAELVLPDLPRIASSPSQQLRVGAMRLGNIRLSDGRIFFRIEDRNTLFVEKSRFSWCGGKVESGSLRISLTDPELSTTLYCDRLQFSELLDQLGISDAEGDGSLNGRLPLVFNGEELVFDDGFLFSTPGDSGIVRLKNTAMLRQGLPQTAQAAYLEYSMQALENFSYNWTKLTFNSTGDDLLIIMQIDGKPANPLPFGYRDGQLVAAPQGQGIQHPIRLDVNFHLPFAQMFRYGQNFQKLMKQ